MRDVDMERYARYSGVLTLALLWPVTHKHAHYIYTHQHILSICPYTDTQMTSITHTIPICGQTHTHIISVYIEYSRIQNVAHCPTRLPVPRGTFIARASLVVLKMWGLTKLQRVAFKILPPSLVARHNLLCQQTHGTCPKPMSSPRAPQRVRIWICGDLRETRTNPVQTWAKGALRSIFQTTVPKSARTSGLRRAALSAKMTSRHVFSKENIDLRRCHYTE